MTKIHNLINSSLSDHKKTVLLDTSVSDILETYLHSFDLSKIMEPFGDYDSIVIDQSASSKIIPVYSRFLSNIIVIDNISQHMDINDTDYWNSLPEMYSKYNTLYKCIFVAINEAEYMRSNNAHNYLININDEHGWRTII